MHKILRGVITDVNSKEYVCHVKVFDPHINRGYAVDNVPFLSRSLSVNTWSGEIEMPERNTICFVIEFNNQHYILDIVPTKHVLDEFTAPINKSLSLTHTDSQDYTPQFGSHIKSAENNPVKRKFISGSRVNRPHDALPGDKFWKTREGAFFGLLRGGVVVAKVHEFCQFMLNRIDAIARLVSRNVQIFTDTGRVDILNDKGNTNISVKVGKTYLNNKNEDFTVRLDVGAMANDNDDGLVKLQITDPDGTERALIKAYSSGRLYVKRNLSEIDISDDTNVYIKSEGNLYLN